MPTGPQRASTFAAVLRRLRENAGLTQAELADRAGIGVRTVSNLERGINTAPYPSTVRLLADALGLPDDAHAVLQAAAGRGGDTGAPDAPTGGYLGALPPAPIVARDDERAAIGAAVDAAARGTGSVVLLAGEPGIGKTRLAQEAMVQAAARGFLVASGRCFEQQLHTPYVPLSEVFGALFRSAPAPLRDAPEWTDLAPLLPDRRTDDGTTWDSAEAIQGLHLAATRLVRRLAEHRPVALLVDDLHWADDATADLLMHLVRHTGTDRVFLLGTYRDAEVGSAHPVRALAHALRRERLTRAITVGRFDPATTRRLVSQRLGAPEIPAELGDLVHRHSEGNPFFAVEIVTALVEQGDLRQVDGRWTCGELTTLEAPLSVSEAIGQRVARLSAAARTVLETASVLGTVFDPDDLPGVADDSQESALDEAVASGLLTVVEDGYAFDHSLTRKALHLGLSPVRRRRLHREVGERLGRRPAPARRRRAAEIARHLEAGGAVQQALPFALLAGDVAADVYSQGEALRLYEHARELAEEIGDDAAGATARERLGRVELTLGRYDAALDHLRLASAAYRRIGEAGARLRVEGMIAETHHRLGDGATAAARLDEVVGELGAAGPTPGVAALANGLARVRLSLGQHDLCVEATEQAVRLARDEGSVAAEADAGSIRGTALLFLDRPDEAVATLESAIALAAGGDALPEESGATLALQWTITMRGDLARARRLGDRGLAVTRRAGNTDAQALHAANLGMTYFYAGDRGRAEENLEHAVALARSRSPTLFSGIPPVYLGVLRAGQGDGAAATALYDEAETAPDLRTFAFAGYLAARRAELDLRAGDPERALQRLEPWLAEEAPTRIHDVLLFVAAAEACLAAGQLDRGEELVARARRRAAATRNELDGIDAHRLEGRCQRLRGRHEAARRSLTEAQARAAAVPYPDALVRVEDELALLDAI